MSADRNDPDRGSQHASSNLLPGGYLHTRGAQILDANDRPVRLAGVNWYGFDCSSMVAGGLDYQPIDAVCRQIAGLGFNTIRLPFCVQVVRDNPTISRYLDANPQLRGARALEIMDALITAAASHGLKVILDSHRSDAGWSLQGNGLWYTRDYPESVWLDAWRAIVQRYAGNPTVIGCDLHNEPGSPPHDPAMWPRNGGAVWGFGDRKIFGRPRNWAAAAERAGNAILEVNPNLLIFVEGVRSDPAGPILNGARQLYWFGGNLMGVGHAGPPDRPAPVQVGLAVPNRLVYSAHDYGPDMYAGLAWCRPGTTAATPDACYQVWDQTWGYLVKNEIAPVWLGEFGTVNGFKPGDRTPREHYTEVNSVNPQGNWFTYLVEYMASNNVHWCYWALNGTQSEAPGRNPALPDWYGILDPGWSEVASRTMMDKLRSIQTPPTAASFDV